VSPSDAMVRLRGLPGKPSVSHEALLRRPERSRLKGGIVEGPCFDDNRLIVERRSLHVARSLPRAKSRGALVGTTVGGCAKMKFGLFYEISVPRPWTRETERTVYNNCLEQVKLADELGFDHVWAVEHHFLEEYSHCSAPELFLTACAMVTKRIQV